MQHWFISHALTQAILSWSFCLGELSEAIEEITVHFSFEIEINLEVKGASEVGFELMGELKKTFFWMKCLLMHAFTALIQLHFEADLCYRKPTLQRTREWSFECKFLFLKSYYHQFTDLLGTRSSWSLHVCETLFWSSSRHPLIWMLIENEGVWQYQTVLQFLNESQLPVISYLHLDYCRTEQSFHSKANQPHTL